jgi:cell shape-determining protein MreD
MRTLLGFFLLAIALIFQTTIVGRITLLQGTADLVLLVLLAWILRERREADWIPALIAGLMVGLASALPIWLPIAGYLVIAGLAHLLQRQVWQVPLLTLFTLTFIGSIIIRGLSLFYLTAIGTPLDFGDAFNLVILPTTILNLFLALPVFGFIGEITNWFYPIEEES